MTTSDAIRVLVYTPGEPAGEARVVANALEPLQRIVGGYLEMHSPWTSKLQVALRARGIAQSDPPALAILCNEDGRLLKLPPNRYGWVGTFIVRVLYDETDP